MIDALANCVLTHKFAHNPKGAESPGNCLTLQRSQEHELPAKSSRWGHCSYCLLITHKFRPDAALPRASQGQLQTWLSHLIQTQDLTER